jgi:hypothetical protein
MDDDDISLYTPEELERLESLRVQVSIHTRVYDVNLLKKGEMDIDVPTLFYAIGWSFVMRFLGSPLLVEGIRHTHSYQSQIFFHIAILVCVELC